MSTQAARFYLKLSDEAEGTEEERRRLSKLDQQFLKRFESQDPFEYDGFEIGEGYFTMFFYGPDADEIISTIHPLLLVFGPREGSYLVRRYGDVDCDEEAFRF